MDDDERKRHQADLKARAALAGCVYGDTLSEQLTQLTGAIYFAHKITLGEPANMQVLDYTATIRCNAISHILSPLVAFFLRDMLAAGKSNEEAERAATATVKSMVDQMLPHILDLGYEYLEDRTKVLERELFGDVPNPEKINRKLADDTQEFLDSIMAKISEANKRNGGKSE